MKRVMAIGAVALLGLAACEQGPLAPDGPQFIIDWSTAVPGGNLHPEAVFVCKEVTGGPAGTSFDFTATTSRQPLNTFIPAFSLQNGDCLMVGQAGGPDFTITVTEAAKAGFVLDSIVRYQALFASGAQPFVVTSVDTLKLTGTNTASASGSGGAGIPLTGGLIIFYNRFDPPPPDGGEGCTPGYWRQPHHFGNWTAPFTPGTAFSDVFADAFPGMTLHDVVTQGGGGLKALGRHAVAALLNAASPDVDYDLTVAEVIAGFNAAFASGDYETQKDIFEGFNEQGCPLGRAP